MYAKTSIAYCKGPQASPCVPRNQIYRGTLTLDKLLDKAGIDRTCLSALVLVFVAYMFGLNAFLRARPNLAPKVPTSNPMKFPGLCNGPSTGSSAYKSLEVKMGQGAGKLHEAPR